MKELILTQGYVAYVDDEDYPLLSRYKWRVNKGKWGIYAQANVDGMEVVLHRFILGAPFDMEVDHKDHNGLNNVKDNLRLCTSSQNKQNTRIRIDNKLGYKGVYFNTKEKKYYAMIKPPETKRLFLGGFDTAVEAARAYNVAAEMYFGEFAFLNTIPITNVCGI